MLFKKNFLAILVCAAKPLPFYLPPDIKTLGSSV